MIPATYGSTPSSNRLVGSGAEEWRANQFPFHSPASGVSEMRPRGYSNAVVRVTSPSPRWISPGDADGRMRVQSMGNYGEKVNSFSPKTTRNRVGINIDVPYSEHPYLIGPSGKKCNSLTETYRALVHFPDTNRRQQGPRLNTVYIFGGLACVENMRKAIRDRSPVRVLVEMSQLRDEKELASRVEGALPAKLRINPMRGGSVVEFKTDWRNEMEMVQFCADFIDPANPDSRDIYATEIELLPLMNPWNVELSSRLVEWVQRRSGCQLFCPDKDEFAERAPVFHIRGASLQNVFLAARFLYGLTMFQLSFVVPPSVSPITEQRINSWKDAFLVHAQVEPIFAGSPPTPPGPHTSIPPPTLFGYKVTLRSFEFLIHNVYRVRACILGLKDPQVVLPEYSFMEGLFPSVIQSDVFDKAKLFYPLYDVAGSGAVDYKADSHYSPKEFFKHFHGGPHSSRCLTQKADDELTKKLNTAISVEVDEAMTAMLHKLLKIDGPPRSAPTMKRGDGDGSGVNP